jgi:hypothetical protein
MNAIRVLISYSNDSPSQQDKIRQLADQLRHDGIDAIVDQYVISPGGSWSEWYEAEISRADFVLMVCSENYLRRFNQDSGPGLEGLWEGDTIKRLLGGPTAVSSKFVPVLLGDGSPASVPMPVRSDYLPSRNP